jgi:Fuc2NAc and GlcNAc transferase
VFKIFAFNLIVFVLTYFGVWIFRRWSSRREIFDIPNERSSHTEPTLRGGGVIIVIICLFAFLILSIFSGQQIIWSYLIGALIVSIVSLFDDVKTISPFWRFLCHSLAAGMVIWQVQGFDKLLIPFYGIVQTGFLGNIIAFLWIVWLINAYNFMDGIDGIAASQAVTAGIGWLLIGVLYNFDQIGLYGGVVAFSALGFLIHNWQPAKIFMGDVGSAFLGFTFAVFPLLNRERIENPVLDGYLPWIAGFLVWFFVFDAVLTLIKRMLRGEKIWQAHREHIYQRLVIAGISHSTVTAIYTVCSGIITAGLIFALKNIKYFELIVFTIVIFESIILLIIGRKFHLNQEQTIQD